MRHKLCCLRDGFGRNSDSNWDEWLCNRGSSRNLAKVLEETVGIQWEESWKEHEEGSWMKLARNSSELVTVRMEWGGNLVDMAKEL